MTKFYSGYWIYAGFIPFVIVIVDQATKFAITRFFKVPFNICELNLYPGFHYELSPLVDLSLVCNPGVSYGLLQGDSAIKRWGLTAFAFFMCGVLLYMLAKTKDGLSRVSIGLIIGGAIGNGIDRALFAAVTDFINFSDIGFKWVFNVADSAITCGVIGLLIAGFLFKSETLK